MHCGEKKKIQPPFSIRSGLNSLVQQPKQFYYKLFILFNVQQFILLFFLGTLQCALLDWSILRCSNEINFIDKVVFCKISSELLFEFGNMLVSIFGINVLNNTKKFSQYSRAKLGQG
jgi:hypothetical protein